MKRKMRKRSVIIVAAVVLVLAVVFAGPACAAEKKFFTIVTSATIGNYYQVAAIMAQSFADRVPEVGVTVEVSQGSVANAKMLGNREAESAIMQNNIAYAAYNGVDQFEGKPVKNLRAVASLYPELIQMVARADSGIKTVMGIRGKRLLPGDRGGGSEIDALRVLAAHGMTYKDIGSVDYLPITGCVQRLQDKQADVMSLTTGAPAPGISELALSTDIVLIPIGEEKIKELTQKFSYYSRNVIPKGTYKGMGQDVATIGVTAQWVVDEQVPEDLVYKLTKALWEKDKDGLSTADAVAKVHAKGKDMQLKTALIGMVIPLHPGAARYYKEKNLIQ